MMVLVGSFVFEVCYCCKRCSCLVLSVARSCWCLCTLHVPPVPTFIFDTFLVMNIFIEALPEIFFFLEDDSSTTLKKHLGGYRQKKNVFF